MLRRKNFIVKSQSLQYWIKTEKFRRKCDICLHELRTIPRDKPTRLTRYSFVLNSAICASLKKISMMKNEAITRAAGRYWKSNNAPWRPAIVHVVVAIPFTPSRGQKPGSLVRCQRDVTRVDPDFWKKGVLGGRNPVLTRRITCIWESGGYPAKNFEN